MLTGGCEQAVSKLQDRLDNKAKGLEQDLFLNLKTPKKLSPIIGLLYWL